MSAKIAEPPAKPHCGGRLLTRNLIVSVTCRRTSSFTRLRGTDEDAELIADGFRSAAVGLNSDFGRVTGKPEVVPVLIGFMLFFGILNKPLRIDH